MCIYANTPQKKVEDVSFVFSFLTEYILNSQRKISFLCPIVLTAVIKQYKLFWICYEMIYKVRGGFVLFLFVCWSFVVVSLFVVVFVF